MEGANGEMQDIGSLKEVEDGGVVIMELLRCPQDKMVDIPSTIAATPNIGRDCGRRCPRIVWQLDQNGVSLLTFNYIMNYINCIEKL